MPHSFIGFIARALCALLLAALPLPLLTALSTLFFGGALSPAMWASAVGVFYVCFMVAIFVVLPIGTVCVSILAALKKLNGPG